MLQLRNIRKSYTTESFTQTALDDVSISFRDNEFVAVLGPSGSGKTTMLNIIGGLDHYDSGDLVIDGISTEQYKDRDWDTYRNNRIGFVFQSYNLIPHQTVLANVELALTLSGVSREERRKRAVEALERVGLGQHVNKKPSQLSGGQMQRVAIARALINDPEILLADEPTGALDSKTSVQVMDLLTEIAKDRLVIMVTHNPELAEQYATRIVSLTDGVIKSDTDPFEPTADELRTSTKAIRRTSMSFLTALSLSFNNLMTKKGRTIMTAFAGSIGIIGIAAILSLANGVNAYIKSVEEDTLSLYPLQIGSSGFDMTAMLVGPGGDSEEDGGSEEATESEGVRDESAADEPTNTVGEISQVTGMLSSIGSNDLASLKAFLDSDESGIDPYVNSIEYSYDVTPQVYSANTENGIRQINPDTSMSALGIGSGVSTNAIMSMSMSTDIFYKMVDDTSMVEGQYDVVAGHWPENYNECVLVLTAGGNISDFAAYVLGLRDHAELEDMIKQFANNEEVDVELTSNEYTYEDVLGLKMKLVNAADRYNYDAEYDVWVDKSNDEEYMARIIEESEDLVISGIVQPKPDADVTAMGFGVYYTSALTDHIIKQAAESQIVKDQLADPKKDVFSGKTFEALEDEQEESGFDTDSLFTIDTGALQSAFSFDPNALSAGMSDIPMDFSSVTIDPAALPQMDFSSIDLDIMSGIDPNGFTFDLSGLNIDTSKVKIDTDILSKAMGDIVIGFQPWYAQNGSLYPDIQVAVSMYMASPEVGALIADAVNRAVDTEELDEDVRNQLMGQLAAELPKQLANQLQQAIVGSIQTQIQAAMQEYMQAYTAAIMTQMAQGMATQMQTAMQMMTTQLTVNMSNAMSINEEAFARAFQFNMDEQQLTELIVSLMSPESASYDGNLSKLGYADKAKPSAIDIYPIDFESKQEVISILDTYNERMVDSGQDDKRISYTDLVGVLMSSVTTIIDAISAVLIAFVAISLIVSSIMIGVITYISVLERRKEIGILRAIGASKGDISRVFNAETVIEGLVSGILGVGITALACIPASAIVYQIYDVPNVAQLPWQAALILVGISVFLTFIAGLFPASSASRKDPVEALRSE